MTLSIEEQRFRESFEQYSAIGVTEEGGLHRLALSDEDRAAREQFVRDLEDADLRVRVDEVGNIFGRRPGRGSGDPVLVGSHLDSQPYGGRYDGQLGVLTALETIRSLNDQHIETDRPVEIVNWTNEEGSRFQPAMLGSGTFAGNYTVDEALRTRDAKGITLEEALEETGFKGTTPCEPHPLHSHLELHVEQGTKLDSRDLPIGVVEGVFGLAWLRITIHGQANHSGPTPMHHRRDALAAAADAINRIEALPGRLSPDAVATVGELQVEPNSINVIPGRVSFTVDLRSYDEQTIRRGIEEIEREARAAGRRRDAKVEWEELARVEPVEFSPDVPSVVEQACDRNSLPYMHLVSGAVHDAQSIHALTDTGMVFVPSVDGITHSEDEFTEWEDCVHGARVFASAVLQLSTE